MKMLVNSCIKEVHRIEMEGGKTESDWQRDPEFTSERDERMKILVNFCFDLKSLS